MPSILSLIDGKDKISLNNQDALIVLPPLQKMKGNGDAGNAAALNLIDGDPNTVVVIHKVLMSVSNTGVTTATYVALYWTDFWTGETQNLSLAVTPSSSNTTQIVIDGLNLPAMPNKPVYIQCDNAPSWRKGQVIYTEVKI